MRTFDAYVPLVLRLGLAVVFFWFGFQQLTDPTTWLGFVPEWTANGFISPTQIILLNGWVEVVLAVILVIGFWLPLVGLILAGHMLFIALDAGGAIGIRDFGLAIACLALAMSTPDKYSLDTFFRQREVKSEVQ